MIDDTKWFFWTWDEWIQNTHIHEWSKELTNKLPEIQHVAVRKLGWHGSPIASEWIEEYLGPEFVISDPISTDERLEVVFIPTTDLLLIFKLTWQ